MISDVLKDAVGRIDRFQSGDGCDEHAIGVYTEHAPEICLVRTLMYALQAALADHAGDVRSRGQDRLMNILHETAMGFAIPDAEDAINKVFSDPDVDDVCADKMVDEGDPNTD
jgi:hypothetical protein